MQKSSDSSDFLSQDQDRGPRTETLSFVFEVPRDQDFVLEDNITALWTLRYNDMQHQR